MARFNKRFEVKREMSDSGQIRSDTTGGKSTTQYSAELEKELNSVGFDDEEIEPLQENIEIEIDENGNPIMPEGWTFLTHGSSLDRWDESLLGNDFVVGNGMVNNQKVKGRPLCCVERDDAKFDYARNGSNTAKAYGGNQQSFEIRILLYKNPRLGDGKVVREKLNQDELKDITKYYMYQDGRHPAVPSETRLVFLQNGDFDEITNTNGNNILWYIPEQYLEQYLEDVQKTKQLGKFEEVPEEMLKEQYNIENDNITMTHDDVEKELSEFYSEDITTPELEAYLSEKISQMYGDRLGNAGIFNIKKFLEGKLDTFEGVESYKAIIEELESALEFAESSRESDEPEVIYDTEEPILEEIKDKVLTQDERTDKIEYSAEPSFEQSLSSAGFSQETITVLKGSIKEVRPELLVKMDDTLSRINEQTLSRGVNKDGVEQDGR